MAGCSVAGGMQIKLRAARLAARSGSATVIAYGRTERVLQRLRMVKSSVPLLTLSWGPDARAQSAGWRAVAPRGGWCWTPRDTCAA